MSGVYWGWQGVKVLGDRRGIGDIRRHWGVLRGCSRAEGLLWDVGSVRDVLGVGRDCRYSGARRDVVALQGS